MTRREDNHPDDPPRTAPRHPDDLRLVQDCVNGDRRRWAELLTRYERTIHFAIVNTLRAQDAAPDPDRVADIQGDLIVLLARERFRKLRLYSGRSRLGQWLKVVAANYTIDQLRKNRPTVSLSADDPAGEHLRRTLTSPQLPPDRQLERRELKAILRALYTELPPDDQRFIELFFQEERSFPEVAEAMDTSLDAAYTRKNRIRNRLLRLARKRGYLPRHRGGGR